MASRYEMLRGELRAAPPRWLVTGAAGLDSTIRPISPRCRTEQVLANAADIQLKTVGRSQPAAAAVRRRSRCV